MPRRHFGAGGAPATLDSLMPRDSESVSLAADIYRRSRTQWIDAAPTVMVGRDPRFTATLERLRRVAESDNTVLITGETGVGKELFARALYLLSRRHGRPYVTVNCAQYRDGHLIASELFGHRKGSFTGAIRDHPGLFECAHSGVLFLDEVAELTHAAQAMLLRVLSGGEVVPVGDTAVRRVNVRVVAASSVDLGQLVETGAFRRDLYHRLASLRVQIPPVRDRGDDWALIREYELRQLVQSRGRPKRFSLGAVDLLSRYAWPGNVRELKALVDTGFHISEGDSIEPCHFLDALEEAGRLHQLDRVPFVDPETQCFDRLMAGQGNFWSTVREPYMDRELNRAQVRGIVARGLTATRGSYKELACLFGLAPSEYLSFMDFLRHHRLQPFKSSRNSVIAHRPRQQPQGAAT